jgi:hypothetical protein
MNGASPASVIMNVGPLPPPPAGMHRPYQQLHQQQQQQQHPPRVAAPVPAPPWEATGHGGVHERRANKDPRWTAWKEKKMKKVGDSIGDTSLDRGRPLTVCTCIKIAYGMLYVAFMSWLLFAIWYLVDPEFRFACVFTPTFCEVMARGCNGVIASGYYYNGAGDCVRNSTAYS